MNKTIEKLKQIAPALCLTAALVGAAAAQSTISDSDDKQTSEADYKVDPKSTKNSEVKNEEFYEMTKMAPRALANGNSEQAKVLAEELLKRAEMFREDWNYGNAIHVSHLVLGQIALDANDLDEAKRQLLEAGKTPGSPQLDTFGPNMILAKELLEKKETATVLKYFELCSSFWKDENGKNDRLEQWKAVVLKGEIPDFKANLLYEMENLYQARQNRRQN